MERDVCARLRLLECHSRLKATDEVQPKRARILKVRFAHFDLWLKNQWHPEIRRAADSNVEELRRRHTDDRERVSVDEDFFVDDARIRVPLLLPIAITHDGCGRRSGFVVLRVQRTTEKSMHPQHVKEVA